MLKRCLKIFSPVTFYANEIRPGLLFRSLPTYDDEAAPSKKAATVSDPLECLEYRHLKTGQGHTYSLISYLNLKTNKMGKFHVNTKHKFERIDLESNTVLLTRLDHSHVYTCDPQTMHETGSFPISFVRGAENFLKFPVKIDVLKYQDEVVKVVLPAENVQEIKENVSFKK
jgi:translation elongation factor P/translation initiation factor 5A